jgi:urease accessory protein
MITAFLAVLQLSDSGLPNGRYTLSHGLETFVHEGVLETPSPPAALLALLAGSVQFGVATSDGIALACAHRAVATDGAVDVESVVRADRRLSAVKLARETREASTRSGRALLRAAPALAGVTLSGYVELIDAGDVPGNHAVVLGLLSGVLGVSRLDAVAAELHAFAVGWVAAAVRLGLTEHLTAQLLLRRVRPVLAAAAERAVAADVELISACTPLIDVMAMRHEEAELRLFAN